jgi:hypothetical protein
MHEAHLIHRVANGETLSPLEEMELRGWMEHRGATAATEEGVVDFASYLLRHGPQLSEMARLSRWQLWKRRLATRLHWAADYLQERDAGVRY